MKFDNNMATDRNVLYNDKWYIVSESHGEMFVVTRWPINTHTGSFEIS
jgi:hypothetical protein